MHLTGFWFLSRWTVAEGGSPSRVPAVSTGLCAEGQRQLCRGLHSSMTRNTLQDEKGDKYCLPWQAYLITGDGWPWTPGPKQEEVGEAKSLASTEWLSQPHPARSQQHTVPNGGLVPRYLPLAQGAAGTPSLHVWAGLFQEGAHGSFSCLLTCFLKDGYPLAGTRPYWALVGPWAPAWDNIADGPASPGSDLGVLGKLLLCFRVQLSGASWINTSLASKSSL